MQSDISIYQLNIYNSNYHKGSFKHMALLIKKENNWLQLEKDILRAVKHKMAFDTKTTTKQIKIDNIVAKVKNSYKESTYNFSNAKSFTLNQNGKKRLVKQYVDLYSNESILCLCLKLILDRTFKVKYPNRNKCIKDLFETLALIKHMSDFTIIKYDFKDYFNTLSAAYIYEKFIKHKLKNRFEINLFDNFTKNTKYTYAGLNTSNIMAEIAAIYFDNLIRKALIKKGVLFFERYIDDSILVLNMHVEQTLINRILYDALQNTFYDKTINTETICKTGFNPKKFIYISKRTLTVNPAQLDYLGYEFFLSIAQTKVEIEYGITKAKRDKYNNHIDKLISCYNDPTNPDYKNIELLRQRIALFTSREVYISKKYGLNIWKVKGFISNYGELRFLLDSKLLHNDTKKFLKSMVYEAFKRANIQLPYFLSGSKSQPGYNLFYNMKVNRTYIFVKNIGYDYKALVNLCSKIGISSFDKNGNSCGYGTLVRKYLIETKVGY